MIVRNRQPVRLAALIALTSLWTNGSSARGEVYPVTTSGQAKSYALTFPNPDHMWDIETYFGSSGDFEANAYQYDSTQPDSPFISCEVTGHSVAHVDASGATGTAELETHWVATNPFPVPNMQSGVFDSENYFSYSFITDTPGTITIHVTTVSNLNNIWPLDPEAVVNYAMAINHTVTFDGEYTELMLNDQHTLVYQIPAGFYQLILEHKPNSGITPWPTCDVYSTTNMTFTIETDPSAPDVMGDMDCDGDLDLDDVPAMVMALLEPELYVEFHGCIENGDFTADELVDGADLQDFATNLVGE